MSSAGKFQHIQSLASQSGAPRAYSGGQHGMITGISAPPPPLFEQIQHISSPPVPIIVGVSEGENPLRTALHGGSGLGHVEANHRDNQARMLIHEQLHRPDNVGQALLTPPLRSFLPPFLQRALNAVVYDYLKACNYGYSLSAFKAECQEKIDTALSREDLLRSLGLLQSEDDLRKGGTVAMFLKSVLQLDVQERNNFQNRDAEWLEYMKGRTNKVCSSVQSGLYKKQQNTNLLVHVPVQSSTLHDKIQDMKREMELDYNEDDEVVGRPEESIFGAMMCSLLSQPVPHYRSEVAVDTTDIEAYCSGNLDFKLNQQEQEKQRRLVDAVNDKSLDERMNEFMREERTRCEQEIASRVEVLRAGLLRQVEVDCRKQYQSDLQAMRSKLEQEHKTHLESMKLEVLRVHDDCNRKIESNERQMFRVRQECLTQMDSSERKVREADMLLARMNEEKRLFEVTRAQETARQRSEKIDVEKQRLGLEELVQTVKDASRVEFDVERADLQRKIERLQKDAEKSAFTLELYTKHKNDDSDSITSLETNVMRLERELRSARAEAERAKATVEDVQRRLDPLELRFSKEVELHARVISAEQQAANQKAMQLQEMNHKAEVDHLNRTFDVKLSLKAEELLNERNERLIQVERLQEETEQLRNTIVEMQQQQQQHQADLDTTQGSSRDNSVQYHSERRTSVQDPPLTSQQTLYDPHLAFATPAKPVIIPQPSSPELKFEPVPVPTFSHPSEFSSPLKQLENQVLSQFGKLVGLMESTERKIEQTRLRDRIVVEERERTGDRKLVQYIQDRIEESYDMHRPRHYQSHLMVEPQPIIAPLSTVNPRQPEHGNNNSLISPSRASTVLPSTPHISTSTTANTSSASFSSSSDNNPSKIKDQQVEPPFIPIIPLVSEKPASPIPKSARKSSLILSARDQRLVDTVDIAPTNDSIDTDSFSSHDVQSFAEESQDAPVHDSLFRHTAPVTHTIAANQSLSDSSSEQPLQHSVYTYSDVFDAHNATNDRVTSVDQPDNRNNNPPTFDDYSSIHGPTSVAAPAAAPVLKAVDETIEFGEFEKTTSDRSSARTANYEEFEYEEYAME